MASASGMYSRYIPPKKPKVHLSTQNISDNVTRVEEPAPPTRLSASNTFSRYIPPPKPKSHDDTTLTPTKRKREQEGELELPKKAKKVQKEKASSSTIFPEAGPPNGIDEKSKKHHTDSESAVQDTTQLEEAYRKKGERKKKQKNGDFETISDNDISAEKDGKHKNLMERREKSLQKAEKIARKEAKKAAKAANEGAEDAVIAEQPLELHDLVPLPQPEPVPAIHTQSLASSLPSWLADPIRIEPTATEDFLNLGISKVAVKGLQERGFEKAFAVQAAVLPLLLPGRLQTPGDILVSAATGSGKTLSYTLPMVENISRNCTTRLRGLIVMPTRELVSQAKEVCEMCASAFAGGDRKRVTIGTAVGNESFKVEQTLLMEREDRYDPEARRSEDTRLNQKWESSSYGSDEDIDDILCDDEPVSRLPDHVIDYSSRVDILICTPGRLVEHLKSTRGFTLEYIKWLVVDEADKLLDQTYQGWLNLVISQLPPPKERSRVRKCVLSATLNRDVGQLAGLKLHRPKLVVLEGDLRSHETSQNQERHILPSQLLESGVKIEEEELKPLYLMELLTRQAIVAKPYISDETTSDSEDSSDSDTSSQASSEVPPDVTPRAPAIMKQSDSLHGVLIFTKSNEAAIRLSRLIALLEPKYSKLIGTLTSTTRSSSRKQTIASFNTRRLSVLVASDLVSRGLDLHDLAHVINYDMPTSVANYVHRVGRTARAGKRGSAWTMFTSTEARWFWNEIGRAESIQRLEGEKIKRVNIKAEVFSEEIRGRYESALEELRKEAAAGRPTKVQ